MKKVRITAVIEAESSSAAEEAPEETAPEPVKEVVEAPKAAPAPAPVAAPSPTPAPTPAPAAVSHVPAAKVKASPLARKLAEEKGINFISYFGYWRRRSRNQARCR